MCMCCKSGMVDIGAETPHGTCIHGREQHSMCQKISAFHEVCSGKVLR